MSVGLGPEWNMNSHHNYAGGISLGFAYSLQGAFALGVDLTVSTNFSGFASLEPTLMIRRYFLDEGYAGFFLQMDAGVFIVFEHQEATPMPELGLKGGYRLHLGSSFFVEPYGRLGYPFAFGIGALAGIRL